MPRIRDLPPPPENPTTSPPVFVTEEEPQRVAGLAGGPSLEALVRGGPAPRHAVVLCHPHPLYGGTMHSAVVLAVAKRLGEMPKDRVAHVRFNYRGVGTSEGSYGEGAGEIEDVRAAIREAKRRFAGARISVCGYSFGTWVGLRAAVLEGGIDRVALIAPAVRVFTFVREDGLAFPGRIRIFLGDADDFCDVDEAKDLAASLGAGIEIFPGADHYFLRGRRALADKVVPALLGADASP